MSKRSQISHSLPRAGAPAMWRSLEERADPSRRETAAASEPEVAVEKSDLISLGKKGGVGRRAFLTASAAATAIGASGCLRRPVENILPYARQPEYVLPGIALHYASVLPRRGDAIGVLVESHEGRPTKIEGNPLHSGSNPVGAGERGRTPHGGTDLQTQAQILNLYDLDRGAHVMRRDGDERIESSWADFDQFIVEHLRGLEAAAGAGLRVLMEPTTSPSLLAARQKLLERFPEARVHYHSAVSDWNAIEGARLAFGRPLHTIADYARSRVIVSLDHDFLLTESGNVRSQRLFAEGRRIESAAEAQEMNRLYVVESVVSVTGANADHRLRVPSRDVGRYARALARRLGSHGVDVSAFAPALGERDDTGIPEAWLDALAADLSQNRGRSAVVVGSRQPPWVHALAHAMNLALDNTGQTIGHFEVLDADQRNPVEDLRALIDDMRGNRVNTLIALGVNPAYDAPADLHFADALSNVGTSIHLASHDDETSEHCTWHLPMSHELEGWSDHRGLDGTYAVQQPLIAPLRNGRNALELIGQTSGERSWRGYHAVRRTVETMFGVDVFDRAWRQALQRGVVGSRTPTLVRDAAFNGGTANPAIDAGRGATRPLGEGNWEVTFVADNKVFDGRWANNPWLLELPDPITKVTWDNGAMISVGSSRMLAGGHGILRNGDLIRIERDGLEALEVPIIMVPGMADGTIALSLGWGRRRGGQYANGIGFDANKVRAADSFAFGEAYSVTRAGGSYPLAMTQEHHSMEGRPIAVDATVAEYVEQPNFGQWAIPQPAEAPLWHEVDYTESHPPAQGGRSWSLLPGERGPEPDGPPRYAWGMTIDLTTCVGCNACVVACIAENNIPMVGKQQVARGRELHWLRIDRYFTEQAFGPYDTSTVLGAVGLGAGDPNVYHTALNEDALNLSFQPMACQHCEEAPCENVCPVNATAHSPEGINEMAYNRCIGTRYCANNCPYKVRRFNYLAYQGHVTELQRMQFNPNVSVRMRGVMEKCTYCVQRVQAARITSRNEGRRIREAELTTACAQACPSQAITFGDLNDERSQVVRWGRVDRAYKALADVGTQPRTTYLGKIRNPNPAFAAAQAAPEQHASGAREERG